ncbi:C2H2-type domain-containing protein [Fusarium keratoplasticum]|uniref:C2H2-type domain-containing protein n=1 Tax=Fusarium keratoplasticum TaxID=1328300 RepID=A0ACC0QT78_9HYPO|nr:C2H2-type domain-containing protein [Fusarium keratoplasticum]KAI8663478.1 C2H2-type domain-containing protein [Fusarium keratoplasticum]
MNEIYQERECTCLARFRSDDDLNDHIEEYRSRERYHFIEAERCRTHARASDDDDQGVPGNGPYNKGGESAFETLIHPRKSRVCPHPLCHRQPPYGSRLSLRRHFLCHVEIDEVCVGCRESFTLANQFVRHIELRNDEQHNNLCKRKATYIRDTCQDLRDLADKDLEAWEKGSKRPLASLGPRPSRRPKLDRPDVTHSFPIQNANGAPYHAQLDTSLMSISDGLVDSTIPQIPCDSMDGTTGALAPIFLAVNYPQFNGGDQGSETVAYQE